MCWVVPGHEPPSDVTREFYGDQVADMYARSGGEGALGDRVWQELDADEADVFVEKTASSAFFPGKCSLHDLLAEREITTLVVTGTVTNVCVEATVRDASTLDYRVILVADACAAVRDQDHNDAARRLPDLRRRSLDGGRPHLIAQGAPGVDGSTRPARDPRA